MSLKFLKALMSLKSLGSLRFLGAFGLLGAIASCTSHTGEGEMEPAAIGFHTHRIEEVGTRALISTTDDLRTLGFGVYGDKTVGTSSPSPQLVFNNIKVKVSGTSWDYEPTKYWDRTADYRFVAYAPWAESVTSYNPENKKLTIEDIPQWQEVNSDVKDYLVATSANTAETYISAYGGTVSLAFQHILAQLTVNIAKVSSTADYKVKGLSFESEVPTGVCYCVYDSSNESLDFSGSTDGQQNLLPTDANIEVGTSSTQLAHYLVAPFDLGSTELKLSLKYTLGSSGPKTVPVPLGITKFESNCSYVFNLRFEAGSNISVSVTEVKNWVKPWETSDEVTDDVYNW